MSELGSRPATNPGLADGGAQFAPASAVLVLDGAGRVTAVNFAARTIWTDHAQALVGEPFVALFEFEVFSREPDFLQAQWDALLTNARRHEIVLQVAGAGSSPRDVRVRIDAEGVVPGGYLATVLPALEAGPAAAPDEARDAFDLLTVHAGFGFFDLDLVTERVKFSPAWMRLLGYTGTEIPATLETWHDLIHPDDSAGAPDRIGRKLPPGTHDFHVEFRLQHQHGHWVWVQCAGVQVVGAGGDLERVVGIQLDITERKELEDALVTNDARLRDLTDTGPLAAFEIDFAQATTWFAPAFERLLGYYEAELPCDLEGFGVVLPEDDVAGGVAAWWYSRAPGLPTFAEPVLLRSKDGRPWAGMLGAHRTLNRKRDLQRIVGFVCPLPAEHAANLSALPAALTETGFHTLAEAVLITDIRRRILFANTTAARLLRAEPATLRGRPVGEVLRLVNRQSLRPADDPVDAALAGVSTLPLHSDDALAPTPDGSAPTPVVWTARVAHGPDGAPQGVAIVFRDPEEMSLTPEELVRANRFETLGLRAGEIAHDINNLLTTILGAISIGRDNRDYTGIADAEQACLTAKALTKQLLAFAKGTGGAQSVCAIRGILEDAIRMAAAGSSAEVTLHVADDVQPVLVDRLQMLQVFQNLILNALQAMPPPPHRPQVQVRAANTTLEENQVPALAAGEYVEVEVRDNGSGIKPEHLEKIFDPFFTTKKHGTGLGLATVLSIARKHGGQIGIDTQVGVGTAFTAYLPKADRPVEVQARRAASLRFGTGRILFMDDDPNISTLTGKMLESLDYKYDLARDGEEALALYRRYLNIGRPYDAVILDLTVVGAMGGEACFAELKQLDPEVRAIVASGYDNDDIAKKFLDQGFCGYLTKPYRVGDLGKVLKAVLG